MIPIVAVAVIVIGLSYWWKMRPQGPLEGLGRVERHRETRFGRASDEDPWGRR